MNQRRAERRWSAAAPNFDFQIGLGHVAGMVAQPQGLPSVSRGKGMPGKVRTRIVRHDSAIFAERAAGAVAISEGDTVHAGVGIRHVTTGHSLRSSVRGTRDTHAVEAGDGASSFDVRTIHRRPVLRRNAFAMRHGFHFGGLERLAVPDPAFLVAAIADAAALGKGAHRHVDIGEVGINQKVFVPGVAFG